MPGSPPPFETRAVTCTGSDCMWAAVVRPAFVGVKAPLSSVPFAWAALWPSCLPEMSLIASTTCSASSSIYADIKRRAPAWGARAASPLRRPGRGRPVLGLAHPRHGAEALVLRGVLPGFVGLPKDHPADCPKAHDQECRGDDRQPVHRGCDGESEQDR